MYSSAGLSGRQGVVQPKRYLKSESDSLYHIVSQVKDVITCSTVNKDVNNENPDLMQNFQTYGVFISV